MPVAAYVIISAVLFTIGALGDLIRRNAIVIFMSAELMLNAANLPFVAFSQMHQTLDVQSIVFVVITVAAAQVATGPARPRAVFRTKHSINVDEISSLRN